MSKRGRPPLGDDRLVHISLRLPKAVVDAYAARGNRSVEMRKALEAAALKENTNAG